MVRWAVAVTLILTACGTSAVGDPEVDLRTEVGIRGARPPVAAQPASPVVPVSTVPSTTAQPSAFVEVRTVMRLSLTGRSGIA